MNKLEYRYFSEALSFPQVHLMPLLSSMVGKLDKAGSGSLKILEIGCGNGAFTDFLRKKGHFVVGLEVSTEGIAIAKENFPECIFIHQSIYDSLPEDLRQSFDLVLTVEVIEHLLFPKELLKMANEALKPGGNLILTTPYHGYLKNLALSLVNGWDRHFRVDLDAGHVKFFSVKTLKQMLIQNGFQSLKFNFLGRFPFLWKFMIVSAVKDSK